MSGSEIKKAEAWLVRIPLKYAYHLSFADISEYRTIIVRLHADDRIGIGESTPLPGYSGENENSVWSFVKEKLKLIPGSSAEESYNTFRDFVPSEAFAHCAINCALELILGDGRHSFADVNVPLVGVINSQDLTNIRQEIETHYQTGCRTFKVKVGREIDKDIERISVINSLLPVGAMMRIDANQGYSYRQAREFLMNIPTDKVELLEQPLASADFEGTARLRKDSAVSIMLDESICSREDITKAAHLESCDYIKLKLMKCGSIQKTLDFARYAKSLGLGVIIGNGVQTEIGCILEAWIQNELKISRAGEMNGFQKQTLSFLTSKISDNTSTLFLSNDYELELSDEEILSSHMENVSYNE